jgi:hypothetical protein
VHQCAPLIAAATAPGTVSGSLPTSQSCGRP